LLQVGSACLSVDGNVIFDGITHPTPRGDAYFGMARQVLTGELDLHLGQSYELDIEFVSTGRSWMQGFEVGCKPLPDPDLMDRAVAAAASADAVIVIVGTNNDWETEGHDRDTLDLPGTQAELIERVTHANANTAVVVNAGAPISTDWAENAPAVLQAWFGGQEMANALVDVLFGDAEPAGRLPTTFPQRIEHTPSFGNFPGEHGQVRYGEGLLMGYRWYEARRLPVAFAFGHGMSYTSFAFDTPRISCAAVPASALLEQTVSIVVPITNTGQRRGAEVVQCYVGAVSPRASRPLKELKAFEKVWLDVGETADVTLTLDARSFSYWDPGETYRGNLQPSSVGLFADTPPATRGWRIDPGTYQLYVGRASDNIAHIVDIEITE
jgi:beta-glucosidase